MSLLLFAIGQMIPMDDNHVIFVCSPKMRNLDELIEKKLFLNDIPIFDTTRQFVMLNQVRNAEINIRYVIILTIIILIIIIYILNNNNDNNNNDNNNNSLLAIDIAVIVSIQYNININNTVIGPCANEAPCLKS